MSLACVGSTRSVPATLGLPRSQRVCFPRLHCSGSRLLYRELALSCMHSPGLSHSGSLGYSTNAQTRLGLLFVPSSVRAAQATRSLTNAVSPGAARLLPSLSQPQFLGAPSLVCLCLFWGSDLWLQPSRRMSTIQNLRKSLVRNWEPVAVW